MSSLQTPLKLSKRVITLQFSWQKVAKSHNHSPVIEIFLDISNKICNKTLIISPTSSAENSESPCTFQKYSLNSLIRPFSHSFILSFNHAIIFIDTAIKCTQCLRTHFRTEKEKVELYAFVFLNRPTPFAGRMA